MRRSIPVTVGFHSGITLPDATLEFKNEEIEERFAEAMVDGAEFTVSISARRRPPGESGKQYVIQEIRFLPIPTLKKEPT